MGEEIIIQPQNAYYTACKTLWRNGGGTYVENSVESVESLLGCIKIYLFCGVYYIHST